MDLYRPPLLEKSRKDNNTAPVIQEALKGIEVEFYYTGHRIGKDLISLTVCSFIEDAFENLFLRLCTYAGLKDQWKGVIINQVKQQLSDLEVEAGFIKSETRYLEIAKENYLEKEDFEKMYDRLQGKVNKKKAENDTI